MCTQCYVVLICDDTHRISSYWVWSFRMQLRAWFSEKYWNKKRSAITVFLDFRLRERQNSLKRNKFKSVANNFLSDPMNYGWNKKSKRPSNLPVQYKRNIVIMSSQDCAYFCTMKSISEFSVPSRTFRNMLKYFECLKYAKLKAKL